MFVARISRGRTIREFIIGVALAPTGFGFVWFAIVGSLATPELVLFTALDALPLAGVVSTMASKGSIAPSKVVTVIFGVLTGGIACAMLLVGGLVALQQAAILGAVPFTFVLIAVTWAWFKALCEEDGTAVLEVGTVDRPEHEPATVQTESAP